jgi:hypothetical protein
VWKKGSPLIEKSRECAPFEFSDSTAWFILSSIHLGTDQELRFLASRAPSYKRKDNHFNDGCDRFSAANEPLCRTYKTSEGRGLADCVTDE